MLILQMYMYSTLIAVLCMHRHQLNQKPICMVWSYTVPLVLWFHVINCYFNKFSPSIFDLTTTVKYCWTTIYIF